MINEQAPRFANTQMCGQNKKADFDFEKNVSQVKSSYLEEIFQTCMKYGQYETGTALRATFPLPSAGTVLQKEIVHFRENRQLWCATLQQVKTNDIYDGNRKVFKMVVRLPNDGLDAAVGSQKWHDWDRVSNDVSYSNFNAVLTYAAEYLNGDVTQLQAKLFYHEELDRIVLDMRLFKAPEQHFCVEWEQGIPEEYLRDHPSVATYVDVDFQ